MPFTVLDKCWWLPHYLPSICQGQGEYIGGFMVKNAAAWNPGSWAGKSWGKNLCKGRKNPRTKGSEPPKAHGSSEPSARHLRLQIRTASTTWKALVVEKTCCFSSRRFRILVDIKLCELGLAQGLRRDAGKVESVSSSDERNEWWIDSWCLDYITVYVVIPVTVGLRRGSESDHVQWGSRIWDNLSIYTT